MVNIIIRQGSGKTKLYEDVETTKDIKRRIMENNADKPGFLKNKALVFKRAGVVIPDDVDLSELGFKDEHVIDMKIEVDKQAVAKEFSHDLNGDIGLYGLLAIVEHLDSIGNVESHALLQSTQRGGGHFHDEFIEQNALFSHQRDIEANKKAYNDYLVGMKEYEEWLANNPDVYDYDDEDMGAS